jgi:hypothetical protein
MNISEDKLIAAVANEVYSDIADRIEDNLIRKANKKLDKIFAEKADKIIEDYATKMFLTGLEKIYIRTDNFGQPIGEPTSISIELNKLISSYWSENVDNRGKPTTSTYNRFTRAEYLMTQICAEDFSKHMKNAAVQVTAELKDGLRAQLAKHIDGLLDSLFKVKSLQDKGKAKKPY